jgi:hypothetical protein
MVVSAIVISQTSESIFKEEDGKFGLVDGVSEL